MAEPSLLEACDLRSFTQGILERYAKAGLREQSVEATMLASLAASWQLYDEALTRLAELNPELAERLRDA